MAGIKMKLINVETEMADGIIWNEDVDESVWDGFFVMFDVENEEGQKFKLQYIAQNSSNTERDYENPTDHNKLESEHAEFLVKLDNLADEISNKALEIEFHERQREQELDLLMS